jgi:hypothetical protein
MSNQNRTGQSCVLCHLRIVLFQIVHVPPCDNLTWSHQLALNHLQRLARWLLAQLLPVTRANAAECGECGRYNRRRGLNVSPTERPFRIFQP